MKRFFQTFFAALLALHLAGAAAISFTADCPMGCCEQADRASASSFGSPACCSADGAACGFEADSLAFPFDEAISGFRGKGFSKDLSEARPAPGEISTPAFLHARSLSSHSAGFPPAVPAYISNSAFLC